MQQATFDFAYPAAFEAMLHIADSLASNNDSTNIDITLRHDEHMVLAVSADEKISIREAQALLAHSIVCALGVYVPSSSVSYPESCHVPIDQHPAAIDPSCRAMLRLAIKHARRYAPQLSMPDSLIKDQEAFDTLLDSMQIRVGVLIDINFGGDSFLSEDSDIERGDLRIRIRARK